MSKPFLHTVLSPRLLDIYDVNNSVVVIIDVFRATSTIATALYNGASKVIPVEEQMPMWPMKGSSHLHGPKIGNRKKKRKKELHTGRT